MRGRFETEWEWIKFNYEGVAEAIYIFFTQENSNTGATREVIFEQNQYRTEELFVRFDLSNYASLSLGVQKVIWGQFEPFSPTNIVFPFNLSITDIEFNKFKGTLPQDAARLAIYPTDKILLEAYAFLEPKFDAVLEQRFNDAGTYSRPINFNGSEFNTSQEPVRVRLPEGSEKIMHGYRALFYEDWGTFGFSYFKGWDGSRRFERFTIDSVSDGGETSFFSSQEIGLRPYEMYGFELAIPWDNWTFLFEVAKIRTESSLDFRGEAENESDLSAEELSFLQAVQNNNDSRLYISLDWYISAFGLEADFDWWKVKFLLFYLYNDYESDDQALVDLQEAAYPEEGNLDWPVFPGLLMNFFVNDEKTARIGFAAGVIGNGAGGVLYYSQEFWESFNLTGGLQTITYFSDDAVDLDNDGTFERQSSFTAGAVMSIRYRF